MTDQYDQRFSGLARVFGQQAMPILQQLHVCVIGIGGVGSWAAEALARTGVGQITLIDADDLSVGNINRQLPALGSTIGHPKVEVMKSRILDINPDCRCVAVDDMLVETNLEKYVVEGMDYVIDAIDSVRFKAALAHFCRRRKIPIVVTGGAGGQTDPARVQLTDLSRCWNDPLAAKVRSRLRSRYGYTRNPKRRFGIDCVFSTEQPLYPDGSGLVSFAKPGVKGVSLDCEMGYGSVCFVTSVFGMMAASRVVNRSLEKKLKLADRIS